MTFANIGKAVARLRTARGLSQAQLADRSGIGRSQVSRYEAGKELMKLATLEKMLATLQFSPEGFFRFLASLDESPELHQPPVSLRTDDGGVGKAFERVLHAIETVHTEMHELRQVVERCTRPAMRLARLIDEAAAGRALPGDASDS
jgi:transcriptional regulator with XRE-family HTH domain